MSRPKLGRSSTSPLLSSAGDDTIMPAMPKSPTLAHFEQYMNKSSDNDGPLFRAVLSELERKALSLRKTVKEVLKAASKCSQCWSETILCQQQLSIALADLCSTGDPLKSNLASLYTSPALQIAEETYSKSIHSLEANLIAPLRAVANDLKAVPSKRKEFDAETKAFDAHMASYLAMRPGAAGNDHQDQNHVYRKERYETAQATFHKSLCEAAIFKQIEVTQILTYAARQQHSFMVQSATDLEPLGPTLDEFALSQNEDQYAVEEARRLDQAFSGSDQTTGQEQEERVITNRIKQMIKMKSSKQLNQGARKARPLSSISVPSDMSKSQSQSLAPPPLPAKALNPDDKNHRIKEGYLFVSAKALTPASAGSSNGKWAKRWIVMDKGTLNEYGEFVEGQPLERKDESINLNFACIKMHPSTDRRWTFSVTTTECVKLYQATSQEEADSWIRAASMQIESLLNGTNSVRHRARSFSDNGTPQRPTELGLFDSASSGSPSARNILSGLRPLVRRGSGYKNKLAKNIKRLSSGAPLPPLPTGEVKLGSLPEATMSEQSFFHFQPENARFSMDFKDLEPPTPLNKQEPTFRRSTEPEPLKFFNDDQLIQAAVEQLAGTSSSQGSSNSAREAERSAVDELYELLSIEGNNECVECRAANPKWTSVSIGCFLCLRCSGIHRSLGSHISKVRSLNLDNWSAAQVACISEVGNVASRTKWERSRPAELVVDDSNVTEFIKAKYVERQYC